MSSFRRNVCRMYEYDFTKMFGYEVHSDYLNIWSDFIGVSSLFNSDLNDLFTFLCDSQTDANSFYYYTGSDLFEFFIVLSMVLLFDGKFSAVEVLTNNFCKINWHKSHLDKLCDKIHELSLEIVETNSTHLKILGWHKLLLNYRSITKKDIPILNRFLLNWKIKNNYDITVTGINSILNIQKQTNSINRSDQFNDHGPSTFTNSLHNTLANQSASNNENNSDNGPTIKMVNIDNMKYKKTGVRKFKKTTNSKVKQNTNNSTHNYTNNIRNYKNNQHKENNSYTAKTIAQRYQSTSHTNKNNSNTQSNNRNRLIGDIVPNVSNHIGEKPCERSRLDTHKSSHSLPQFINNNKTELPKITYHPPSNNIKSVIGFFHRKSFINNYH